MRSEPLPSDLSLPLARPALSLHTWSPRFSERPTGISTREVLPDNPSKPAASSSSEAATARHVHLVHNIPVGV